MQPLNAIDAISPAIARTRLVLFSPFRVGRSWKLAITGYLAFTATFFLPFPLFYLSYALRAQRAGHAQIASLVIAAVAVLLLLFLLFFYVCARLEFVFFEIVLRREQFVAPAWRRYAAQTWPWIAVKLVLGAVVAILFGAPLLALIHHGLFSSMMLMKPGQPPPPDFFINLLKFEFVAFGVFGFLFLVGSLLTDFVLPSLALEDTSLAEAFRRFFGLLRREPAQVAGYIGMKVLLAAGGYIGQMVIYYATLILVLIALAIVFVLGYIVLHLLHVPVAVMLVLAAVVGITVYFISIFYVLFLLMGTVLTFLQAYALYFLGGRYPLVGLALEASTPPPPLPAGWYTPPPQGYWPPPPPAPPESV